MNSSAITGLQSAHNRHYPAQSVEDTRSIHPPASIAANADQIYLGCIDAALPVLKKELAEGRTHRFKGLQPRILMTAVMDEDARRGLGSVYFDSPRELKEFIAARRQELLAQGGSELLVTGAVLVSPKGHHAAVVCRLTPDDAGILVIDSIPDLQRARARMTHPSSWLQRAASALYGSYQNHVFETFGDAPNTSVYYTYLGTQASMTDCAAFSVHSLRSIVSDPHEMAQISALLRGRSAHVAASNNAELPPGCATVIPRCTTGGQPGNTNFVLRGEDFLSPKHYLHTQSSKALARYCAASPYIKVAPAWEKYLWDVHKQHRRRIKPLYQLGRSRRPVMANISIRQEQLFALIQARDSIYARFVDAHPERESRSLPA